MKDQETLTQRGRPGIPLPGPGTLCDSYPSVVLTLDFYLQEGPADLKHFDPEFTQEAVSKSIGCTPDTMASSSGASSAFLGFAYAQDDNILDS